MRKLVLLIASAFALPLSAQNLPMFRGDLRHSGIYDGPGVRNLSGVKWAFKTGARVVSSPAVANGVVYVGGEDHKVYAFHLPHGD